jgi:hypothetical protein
MILKAGWNTPLRTSQRFNKSALAVSEPQTLPNQIVCSAFRNSCVSTCLCLIVADPPYLRFSVWNAVERNGGVSQGCSGIEIMMIRYPKKVS